jgi:hypothetical protein
MGFIESPLRRHSRSCVHSRLDRRPGFGPGLPHPGRVPLLPFLPASAASSAGVRSEDRTLERPAGLLHPAAGRGVRHVSDSRSASRPSVTRRSFRSLPQWRRPFEAFSSPDSQTTSSPPSPRGGVRSPDGVPSRRWTSCAAVRVATVRCLCPRPQGFLPPGELVVGVPRCHVTPLDAPMGFGSTRSDACRARRAPDGRWPPVCTRRHQTAPGVPPPESDEKAKILGFVWLRAGRCWDRPEGRPPAGPARWQPEDCYASGPARLDPRRSPTGIGRMIRTPRRAPGPALCRTPKGTVERR